ncbi:MAG: adenylate/guanylate cyclase domain-containing protein, partial [Anaerolineales bacterium]
MHNLVPGFITKQLKNGNKFGQFPAVCLFVDLAGYSTMTTALMELGQHGAEVLATIMRALFDPMINTIYQYGGFIATFSGDSFTAVFPHSEDQSNLCMNAVASALKLQEIVAENRIQTTTIGEFDISIRVGVSDGETSW